ncbi:quinolinate synthase NadA [Candidatus Contubernalis alkaliaceticus]|uniref:quinolinate synthase NadA n=1 Tax=Candidatus Contubernalis alkaliaceticus TaxID=338645 RepID=UPI001F4BF34E|nr:quinolinate synthase NadA [Candidatus Contubernalis alkalaceticus]UNC93397.1 quinolinate synthase NadA [Candidatus Contubernalis alkalaceticus]
MEDKAKILIKRLSELKDERNAVVLAHNYQIDEVQDCADHVGDSFELSRIAAETPAQVIVFCGVHFMAESAKILAPNKTVLLPETMAGCPMADMAVAEKVREMKEKYPKAAVACYINTSAAVKAECDVCVTSANALKVINNYPADEFIFLPDQNLGNYVAGKTQKKIILWDGYCITHHRVTAEEARKAREAIPGALLMVHPECRPEVVDLADKALGTGGMLRYAGESQETKFIVGTEMGLIYRLKKENPSKEFYLLSAGMICPNMKLTNLQKVVDSLENMSPQIEVPEDISTKAKICLDRMMQYS